MSSPRSRFPFAILSWGGIGDTLRNLLLIPHAILQRKFGFRTPVVHQPWQEVGCREDALPPGPAAIRDLIERCPSLRWGGVGVLSPCAKISNRLLRDAMALSHPGGSPLYPLEIQLKPEEKGSLPQKDTSRLQVGIQTHLLGMPSKKWALPSWRAFLRRLRERLPTADFHLIEPAEMAVELKLDDHFHLYPRFNLAQSIALVRQMDLIISIDSWAKYVAAMDRLPQIIIIPDQRSDYPQLTPASLLRHEYASLKNRPEIWLIGLDHVSQRLTLPIMNEIQPDALFLQIAPILPEYPIRGQ